MGYHYFRCYPENIQSFLNGFVWGFGIENWRGLLVNLQLSPFPRKRSMNNPSVFQGSSEHYSVCKLHFAQLTLSYPPNTSVVLPRPLTPLHSSVLARPRPFLARPRPFLARSSPVRCPALARSNLAPSFRHCRLQNGQERNLLYFWSREWGGSRKEVFKELNVLRFLRVEICYCKGFLT